MLLEAPAAILRGEGVAGEIEVVGDVMVDVAQLLGPRAAARTEVLERFGVEPGEYLLATAHRAGNVDDPTRLARLVALLEAVPGPVVLPLHPRTARGWTPARSRGAAPASCSRRRSATSTSPRCCATRARC